MNNNENIIEEVKNPNCAVCHELLENCTCGDEVDSEPNDNMDGDATSALASAGFGTDEDYQHGDEGWGGDEF